MRVVIFLLVLAPFLLADDWPNLQYYRVDQTKINQFNEELPDWRSWKHPDVRDTDRQYWKLLEQEERLNKSLEENLRDTVVSVGLARWSDNEVTLLSIVECVVSPRCVRLRYANSRETPVHPK